MISKNPKLKSKSFFEGTILKNKNKFKQDIFSRSNFLKSKNKAKTIFSSEI